MAQLNASRGATQRITGRNSTAGLEAGGRHRRGRDGCQVVADHDAEPAVGDVLAVGDHGAVAGDLGLPLLASLRRSRRGCVRRSSTTSRSPRRTAAHRAAPAATPRGPRAGATSARGRRTPSRPASPAGRRRGASRRRGGRRARTSRRRRGRGRCRVRAPARRPGGAWRCAPARCRRAPSRGRRCPASPGRRGRAVRSARSRPGRSRPSSGRATQSWTPCRVVGAWRGDLRVADAVAAGHQVELARADQRVVAGRVAVLDLAGEQPADGLQAGVRVRGHDHAPGVVDLVGAVVVGEAPRADERALALREGTPHAHRPQAAEGDVAGGEYLAHDGLTSRSRS